MFDLDHFRGPKQDRTLEAPWHLRYKTFGPPELMKILLPQKSGQKESCSARRDESGGWHPFFSQTNIFPPNFSSKYRGVFHQSTNFDEKLGGKILVCEKNGCHPPDSSRRAEQLSF